MKKTIAWLLCLTLLASMTACAGPEQQPATTAATAPTAASRPAAEVITDSVRAQLDALMAKEGYEGIAYLTHNGKVVYQYASGANDLGEALSVQSPMYVASISKQFCAAAILMLRDQGKLSLDDKLEEYFPEYTIGKEITLKNLLSMRSGIVRDFLPLCNTPQQFEGKTPEEIRASSLSWLFEQPLISKPDTEFFYSNVNYTLLSYVVEIASGQSYEDFVRHEIFEPLGMTHSGFIHETAANPQWGLTYDAIYSFSILGDSTKGCGDIVSTAGDMDIWMTALQSGKVICEESYREMITDHSPASRYGYGMMGGTRDGWGHNGNNKGYTARMYFNEEYGYNLFIATGKTPSFQPNYTDQVSNSLLKIVFAAEDSAAGQS